MRIKDFLTTDFTTNTDKTGFLVNWRTVGGVFSADDIGKNTDCGLPGSA